MGRKATRAAAPGRTRTTTGRAKTTARGGRGGRAKATPARGGRGGGGGSSSS